MNALRAYRALLGNRPLTRLLSGEFISGIGDWLYLVALLIVIYEHSQDVLLLGIVGAARILPYVLLSVPAGIAADRFDRRMLLIVTDTARALIMLAIAWLVATDGPVEAIVALAILATCFSTFFGPTIGAYLPSLVKDERQLGPANSAWASLDNLAFVIGPVLAGVLVAAGGLTVAFLLNAVSFLIVDVILWGLPKSVASPAGGDGSASATDAARPASPAGAPEPPVRLATLVGLSVIDVIGSFVFGGVGVLTVLLAATTYGSGDAGTGYLNGAIGVGGLVGAIVSGALVLRTNLGPSLVLAAVASGVGLVALGFVGSLVPALVALIVASGGSLILEVVSLTIFQRAVPDRIRGRALGIMATASSLTFATGSFLIPVLADRFGVAPVLGISGVAVALGALGGLVLVGDAVKRAPTPFDATIARVAGLPIFAGVSSARLETALGRIVAEPVSAGSTVIRQGEPADRFYVIQNGRFRVTQRDGTDGAERLLREMGPDEVFGEIGLLRESPRTATVVAITEGLLLSLDRDAFLALVAADARLGSRLLDLRRAGAPATIGTDPAGMSAS